MFAFFCLHPRSGVYILEKKKTPGGEISADVIWGKKEKWKRKNVKEKGRQAKKKEEGRKNKIKGEEK